MQKHPLHPTANPPRYLNHFTGNRLLGCVEEGQRCKYGEGRKKEKWGAERKCWNMLWQQLVLGITELKVLHA